MTRLGMGFWGNTKATHGLDFKLLYLMTNSQIYDIQYIGHKINY